MGYALLKAKSSKILKQEGGIGADESAEGICSLYVAYCSKRSSTLSAHLPG